MSKSNILNVVFFILMLISAYAESANWEVIPIKPKSIHVDNFGEGFQVVESIEYSEEIEGTVYLGTNTSQIWKSTDSGSSWRTAREGILSHGVVSISIPRGISSSKEEIFVASSQGLSKSTSNKYPHRHEGIYRSNDGGETWKFIKNANFSTSIHKGDVLKSVAINKKITLLAGTVNDGLIITRDGGLKWSVIDSTLKNITDIELDRNEDVVNFYITDKTGLYSYDLRTLRKIEDSQDQYPVLSTTCVDNNGYSSLVILYSNGTIKKILNDNQAEIIPVEGKFDLIEIDSNNCNNMYATKDRSRDKHIYYTKDGGKHWKRSILDINLDTTFDKPEQQMWFSSPIKINPFAHDHLLTVSNGKGRILSSTDGAATWKYSGYGFHGARMNDVFVLQDNSAYYCFTDHGIWRKNAEGDFEYLNVPRIYGQTSCGTVWDADGITIATIGNWYKKSIIYSKDKGKHWIKTDVTINGNEIFISDHDNNLYIGKYRSIDRGLTWEPVNYHAIGNNHANLLVARYYDNNIEISEVDKTGATDTLIKNLPIKKKHLKEIRQDIVNGLLYIATGYGVYKLEIATKKYEKCAEIPQDSFGLQFVSGIEVMEDGNLYIGKRAPGRGQSNGIFSSDDRCQSWNNVNYNLGDKLSIWEMKRGADGKLYIGTSLGTYVLVE